MPKGSRGFTMKDGRVVTLRPLRAGDLDALVTFANDVASERKRNPDLGIVSLDRRMTRRDEKEFLEKQLGGMRKKALVSVAAFHGPKMVGHCDVFARTQRDVRHTGVLGIVIMDGYRGGGLGEAMMRAALGGCARVGVWLVELTAFASNSAAISLYRKLGFRKVGIVPRKILRYGKYTDEVVMYLNLRQRSE